MKKMALILCFVFIAGVALASDCTFHYNTQCEPVPGTMNVTVDRQTGVINAQEEFSCVDGIKLFKTKDNYTRYGIPLADVPRVFKNFEQPSWVDSDLFGFSCSE
jgi:hypothetical protein